MFGVELTSKLLVRDTYRVLLGDSSTIHAAITIIVTPIAMANPAIIIFLLCSTSQLIVHHQFLM